MANDLHRRCDTMSDELHAHTSFQVSFIDIDSLALTVKCSIDFWVFVFVCVRYSCVMGNSEESEHQYVIRKKALWTYCGLIELWVTRLCVEVLRDVGCSSQLWKPFKYLQLKCFSLGKARSQWSNIHIFGSNGACMRDKNHSRPSWMVMTTSTDIL